MLSNRNTMRATNVSPRVTKFLSNYTKKLKTNFKNIFYSNQSIYKIFQHVVNMKNKNQERAVA